jgi:uncharacterized repeat protein (TIGR03803 family)
LGHGLQRGTGNGDGGTNGTIFNLVPGAGGWQYSTFYEFGGMINKDGAAPGTGLALDSRGNLYGVTYAGGYANGGTIYEIQVMP